MRLSQVPPGVRVKVLSMNLSGDIQNRLVGMGLIPGVIVEVVKVAPLGDPIVFSLNGREITLRKKEAEGIEVEPVDEVIPLYLAMFEDGEYEVIDVFRGRRFLEKMKKLGVFPGERLRVKDGIPHLKDKVIPLGKGEALKILVKVVKG